MRRQGSRSPSRRPSRSCSSAASSTVSEMAFARTGCIRHDLLDRGLLIERTASHGRRYWRDSARASLAWLLGRSNRFDEARAMWRELIAEDSERADPRVVWDLRFLAADGARLRCLGRGGATLRGGDGSGAPDRSGDGRLAVSDDPGRDRRLPGRGRAGAPGDPPPSYRSRSGRTVGIHDLTMPSRCSSSRAAMPLRAGGRSSRGSPISRCWTRPSPALRAQSRSRP